ncbi:MAG TPA: DUF4402 domain-containing protein [Sphingomicrobium sp.]|nr:DUF4402 domain-containing protein [Sphingomicrobium sp.]
MIRALSIIARPLAVAALAAMPMGAHAAQITVRASANVIKPLILSRKQDMTFGQILLSPAPGTRTVSISQAGILSCGAGLTCSGVTRPAIFNASGTKSQRVIITAVASDLVSPTGATVRFTPNAPPSVTLANSGNPGTDFTVGGSITINENTPDGLYSGNIELTADYQ